MSHSCPLSSRRDNPSAVGDPCRNFNWGAAGHLAPTPTVAQSTTATKPTLQPPTPVNALARLQSQVITNVDDFLSTLKPHTPVNFLVSSLNPTLTAILTLILLLRFARVYGRASGLVILVPGHTRFTLIYAQPTYTQISLNKTF